MPAACERRRCGATVNGWISLAVVFCVVIALAVLWTRLRPGFGRQGSSLAAFLRTLDATGVPDDVALAIHHHLEHWMADSGRPFSVGARDALSIYGIAPEDVDDTLGLLLAACGRRAGDVPRPPLHTVEELVRYVASCPRIQDA
jgi:hypothetical protein